MNLPDQTQQSPGDAFHSGLGGDPCFYVQDHTETQLSYKSNQGPVAKSDRMLEGWRHKVEWTRFEVDVLTRCGDDFELTGHVTQLLIAGKHDGRTQTRILEAIRLQEATRTRLDDFDLVDVVTMLKGF
jgi:hypothetical protein